VDPELNNDFQHPPKGGFLFPMEIQFVPGKVVEAEIFLPLSKSESNRALMMQVWSKGVVQPGTISDAEDSILMEGLLFGTEKEVYDARDAGTVFRFLAPFLAINNQCATLTGTSRMLQRPVGDLVSALRQLGCRIEYAGMEGFPPLIFNGFEYSGIQQLRMNAGISSQFISALMMAAPSLPHGLQITFEGEPSSFPYLQLTAGLMQQAGIRVELNKNEVRVFPGNWKVVCLQPGADWSAAAAFYGIMASLPTGSRFFFPGLQENSLQGDKELASLFRFWNIETSSVDNGIVIRKFSGDWGEKKFSFDFSNQPDLALSLIATCAATGVEGDFLGLHSLKIKESDRLNALRMEMAKVGISLQIQSDGNTARLEKSSFSFTKQVPDWDFHKDHRIAMALAILLIAGGGKAHFRNPEVVRKSFPSFWKELMKAGFRLRP
jgi:3-phosphoshikimate 1-carboxyvinyltransferase